MFFDETGIDIQNWKLKLLDSNSESSIEKFIIRMKEMKLQNSILVDCTANDNVVKYYDNILSSSFSIVTPNKIANTQKLQPIY